MMHFPPDTTLKLNNDTDDATDRACVRVLALVLVVVVVPVNLGGG